MKKIINLGFVQLPNETKRRRAIAEVELRNNAGKYILSICGEIKRCSWGQCKDFIEKYIVEKRKNFDEIMEIWEQYHLNDMHAGTEQQETALKNAGITDFNNACEFLKNQGLYIDNGYRYGSKWLYRPIPENILNKIFNW